jgi:nucleotide-binding universal stress UspA family protein
MIEQRDDRGRLVSVVVDGQRFHRADDAELNTAQKLLVAEQLARDALAEVRSLRGVVQALRELCDEIEADGMKGMVAHVDEIRAALAAAADAPQPGPERANTPTARKLLAELQAERQAAGDDAASDFCGTKPGAFSHLRRSPAQPADPPASDELRCERPGGCVCDPFRRSPDCRWSVGPSPAVLPETPKTKDQR